MLSRSRSHAVRVWAVVIGLLVGLHSHTSARAAPPLYRLTPLTDLYVHPPVAMSGSGVVATQTYLSDARRYAVVLVRNGTAVVLPQPPDGATLGGCLFGIAVNDQGDVATSVLMADGGRCGACVWRDGVPHLLRSPEGSAEESALSVSNDGVVSGFAYVSETIRPALWRRDELEMLPMPPGALHAAAVRENADGGVVLWAVGADAREYAVVWRAGSFTRWETPPGFESTNPYESRGAFAVGICWGDASSPLTSPIRWNAGVAYVLDVPALLAGYNGTALAINQAGDAVGAVYPQQGFDTHAVLWMAGGVAVDLNDRVNRPANTMLRTAWGIADNGVILAEEFGDLYLLTPRCTADFNDSGSLSPDDLFAFLVAYFGHQPIADIDYSHNVGVQDLFEFLAAYFAGCS